MSNLTVLIPLRDNQIDILLDALALEKNYIGRFTDPGDIFERNEDIHDLAIHLVKHQSKIPLQPKDIA